MMGSHNQNLPDGLPFFTTTLVLFLLFPLFQLVVVLGAQNSSSWVAVPILAGFSVLTCLLVAHKIGTHDDSIDLAYAICLPIAALFIFSLIHQANIATYPAFYFGLSALTLGFAYLPANKIQRLSQKT